MKTYRCDFYYSDGTRGTIITWERYYFDHAMYKTIWNELLWLERFRNEECPIKAEIVTGDYTYIFYRDLDGIRTIKRIALSDLK